MSCRKVVHSNRETNHTREKSNNLKEKIENKLSIFVTFKKSIEWNRKLFKENLEKTTKISSFKSKTQITKINELNSKLHDSCQIGVRPKISLKIQKFEVLCVYCKIISRIFEDDFKK
jgi:hypothetical protein